jgi:hypothetical protein
MTWLVDVIRQLTFNLCFGGDILAQAITYGEEPSPNCSWLFRIELFNNQLVHSPAFRYVAFNTKEMLMVVLVLWEILSQ